MAIDKNVNVTFTGQDNVSPIAKKLGKVLGKDVVANLQSVGMAFIAVNQAAELTGKVFSKVGNAASTVINAANKQEDAVNKLNSSLMQLGEFSAETSTELQLFAAQMQQTTRFGDESSISMLAFAQAMGATVDQSKTVVSAAADISAALGIGFDSAVKNLTVTLSGLSGELGEKIPELKALTKEQLQAGKAIDLLAKKFQGFAQRDAQTFSGAVDQAKNSFGDLLEQVGFLVTKNEVVISAIGKANEMFSQMAKSISEIDMASFSEDIKDFGTALGIASAAVGTYIIIANGAAIATAAWGAAATVLAGAMAVITSPITLAVAAVAALTAGIYLLIKNIDLVTGALKVGLGFALQAVTLQVRLLLKGLALAVGVFNKDWAKSIDGVVGKLDGMIEGLKTSGRAQMAAAKAAKQNSESTKEVAKTAEVAKQKILEQEQALVKLNVQYSKAVGAAKTAFDAAAEFSPSLKLDKFLQEQNAFEKALKDLQKKGEDLKIRLQAEGDSEAIKQQIDQVSQKQAQAEEALKALRIRKQQEFREASLQEVQIQLEQQKQKVFTTTEEIKQMRLAAAQEIRDRLVQIETDRLLQQRGLLSADSQAGISIKQEAALRANEVELQAFRNKLDAEKNLALSAEQQKQMELASLRSSLLQGTSAGAEAAEDVEVQKERQKIAQLQALREQNLISEAQYQMDRNAIVTAGKQRQFELEVAAEQERIAALGLSPEALNAKLELQRQQDEMELQNLRMKLQNKQLTEDEFRIANEQLEMSSQDRARQTREQFLQQEIQQNRMRGESFKATLKEIELAQQQHGKVMGTLRAVQGSAEFGAIQGMLGNLSQLRNSESRKEFEIGKKAAIAQTVINTFMSATAAFSALAGIPIVGPVLGTAAAAAAVAAGMMNVRQIKSQKFGGGGSGGMGAAPAAPAPSATLGGQAHEGMDAVPRSMHNKSFIVAGGERIVQPQANKDLTNFLSESKQGGMGGGNNINISIGSVDSDQRVQQVVNAVKEAIRRDSERGEPIINSKGIVNG